MTKTANALRAALPKLWELIEEAYEHSCTCGQGEWGEQTCPHCNRLGGARRFMECAGYLKATDADELGEWIFAGQEGWVYEPPAPF